MPRVLASQKQKRLINVRAIQARHGTNKGIVTLFQTLGFTEKGIDPSLPVPPIKLAADDTHGKVFAAARETVASQGRALKFTCRMNVQKLRPATPEKT